MRASAPARRTSVVRRRAANFGKRRERAGASEPMVDDRQGVGPAEDDAGLRERFFPAPAMARGCAERKIRELRDPAADIGAVGVNFFALQNRVEDAEEG